MSKYVEGYGPIEGYDGPYHPSANFDPAVVFANAGDPQATAEAQAERDLSTEVKEETQAFAEALNNTPVEPDQFSNAGDVKAAAGIEPEQVETDPITGEPVVKDETPDDNPTVTFE